MKKKTFLILSSLVLLTNFYGTPFIMRDTGSLIFGLLILFPFATLLVSLLYASLYKINILYSVGMVALFLPTVYIFYNDSALIYVVIYFVFSLIGQGIGRLLYREREDLK